MLDKKDTRFAKMQIFIKMIDYYNSIYISWTKIKKFHNKSLLLWTKERMHKFLTTYYNMTKDKKSYLPNSHISF